MKKFLLLIICLAVLLTACSNTADPQNTSAEQTTGSQTGETTDIGTTVTAESTGDTQTATGETASGTATTVAAGTSGTTKKPTTAIKTATTAPSTAAPTTKPSTMAAPPVSSKINAVWISYLEYDSGLLNGKTEAQFRANLQKAFNNCINIGVNTAFVQVRPYGDAVYESKYFPWSKSVTGTFGAKPNFDPLKVIIQEAKKKGIRIHAWVNPFRLMEKEEILILDDTSIIKKLYNSREGNDYIKLIKEPVERWRWYLNPASAEAQKLIVDGIAEIVKNYDVDGIQIDDYFYPTTALDFDDYSYAQSGTALSRSVWRQNNISKLVSDIYTTIKSIDSSVLFGISPQGSIESNYSSQYADVRLWCSKSGYLDYICPQLYYGFENASKPFEKTAAEWNSLVKISGIKLVCGLAVYKIGNEDGYAGTGSSEWIEHGDIIPRQIRFAKTLSNDGGVAFFRFGNLFKPDGSMVEITKSQTQEIRGALG